MAIMGNIELAIMKLEESSPALPNLNQATESGDLAANLTNKMLAYTGGANIE